MEGNASTARMRRSEPQGGSVRYVVIGGGIVGLATAHRLTLEHPGADVTVVEKEQTWGAHQTGHNSGVIHAGVYYKPGSSRRRCARRAAPRWWRSVGSTTSRTRSPGS